MSLRTQIFVSNRDLLIFCHIHVMKRNVLNLTCEYFSQDSEKKRLRRESDLVNNELKMANKEFIKVSMIDN